MPCPANSRSAIAPLLPDAPALLSRRTRGWVVSEYQGWSEAERPRSSGPSSPPPPPPPEASESEGVDRWATFAPEQTFATEHEQPPRRSWRARAPIVVVAVAISIAFLVKHPWTSSGPSARPPIDFSNHGVSFHLPAGWRHLSPTQVRALQRTGPLRAAWREVFALDRHNLVLIIGEQTPLIIDRSNVRAFARGILSDLRAAGRPPLSGSTRVGTIAGFPSFERVTRVATPDGTPAHIQEVIAFQPGSDVAELCQSTAGRRQEVTRACNTVRSTLHIESPADPTQTWHQVLSRGRDITIKLPPRWKQVSPGALEIRAEFRPSATAAVAHDRLPRAISTNQYARFVLHEPGNHFRLLSRRQMDLPSGRMVREAVSSGAREFFLYLTARGRNGYAVIFETRRGSQRLLQPTTDAIAGTLRVPG